MKQNETEAKQKTRKSPRKRRRRLLIWLTADILVAATVLILLFHTPSGYIPNTEITDPQTIKPQYWSDLGAEIYRQAQRKAPFDLVIEEPLVNDAIRQGRWPRVSDDVKLYAPTATFMEDHVQLMGTVEVHEAELVLTIRLDAGIDPNGLASLNVTTVKIGAMGVTALAKIMGRKAYQNQIGLVAADPDRIETKIVSSLLDGQSFDPVFYVRNTDRRLARVRVLDLTFQDKQIIARIAPAD